jgi:hypothetical protein
MKAYNSDPMAKAFLGNLVMNITYELMNSICILKTMFSDKYANGGLFIEALVLPFTTFPLPFHHLPTTQVSPSLYPFTTFPLPFHLLPTTPSPHSHSPFYTYSSAYPFSLSPLRVRGLI